MFFITDDITSNFCAFSAAKLSTHHAKCTRNVFVFFCFILSFLEAHITPKAELCVPIFCSLVTTAVWITIKPLGVMALRSEKISATLKDGCDGLNDFFLIDYY